jgi:hypothetical protein
MQASYAVRAGLPVQTQVPWTASDTAALEYNAKVSETAVLHAEILKHVPWDDPWAVNKCMEMFPSVFEALRKETEHKFKVQEKLATLPLYPMTPENFILRMLYNKNPSYKSMYDTKPGPVRMREGEFTDPDTYTPGLANPSRVKRMLQSSAITQRMVSDGGRLSTATGAIPPGGVPVAEQIYVSGKKSRKVQDYEWSAEDARPQTLEENALRL